MSAEQDEYDDALAEAAAASARLGITLGRWQLALDRLGRATKALHEQPATPGEEAARLVRIVQRHEHGGTVTP